MRIYFDHNATTPVDPAVVQTMARILADDFGNASSVHHFGQRAKAVLDDARSLVATLVGGEPVEIVFTSGGTESDNFALRGVAEALEPTGRRHLIASSIEHEAVLTTFKALARRGWRTTLLPVSSTGIVDPPISRLRSPTIPRSSASCTRTTRSARFSRSQSWRALAHDRGALFHTDAVQSVGKIPVNVKALGVDFLSLSAHKFNGPKGAGALWIKRGARVTAILTGGKHERSRRAGTENVPGLPGSAKRRVLRPPSWRRRRRGSPLFATGWRMRSWRRCPGPRSTAREIPGCRTPRTSASRRSRPSRC